MILRANEAFSSENQRVECQNRNMIQRNSFSRFNKFELRSLRQSKMSVDLLNK